MSVRKNGAVATALLAGLLFAGQVRAQDIPSASEQATSVLRVITLYDKDHDGQDEGVGPGVVVSVRESGSTKLFYNVTNPVSEADFGVAERTYIVDAYPPQTRFFFHWVCHDTVAVDKKEKVFILYCFEQFFVRLPWSKGE